MPSMWSGNQRRWSIAATLYHRPHAPLERGRRRRRGDDEDVREDVDPRRLPRLARPRRPAGRRRVPHRPPVPRDRPADARRSAGRASPAPCCAWPGRRPTRSAARTTARPTSRPPSPRCSPRPGHAPDPAGEPSVAEVRETFEQITDSRRRGAQGGAARGAHRPLVAAHRRRDRQGAQRRAPDRPPRRAARGGDREGVRPPARRRQAGGHAHRRHRPDRGPRPGGPARQRRADAVQPAQVHARLARRGRGGDPRPPRARPSGWRTSTTGSAPSSTAPAARSASTRATCTTSAASSRRSSRVRATCPGRGSWTASCSPGRTAWCCRSSSSRRGSAARTRRRRSSRDVPVIYVAWDVLGMDRDADTVVAPLLDRPLTERRAVLETLALPLAEEGGRFALSYLASRRLDRRPRGGVRRGPRPAQRGPDGQGPPERLLARAAAASAG